MNTHPVSDQSPGASDLHLLVSISDTWLQNLANEKKLVIPLKEKYHLHQFQFSIFQDELLIRAAIREKPESTIELLGKPKWDSTLQRLYLDEFKIDTNTKNILLKSAGWVASKFLHEKVDRMLEEKLNEMFRLNLQKIINRALVIPIRDQSTMNFEAHKILIQSMSFKPGRIEVVVDVNGIIQVYLKD